jgi:hypothetical protein
MNLDNKTRGKFSDMRMFLLSAGRRRQRPSKNFGILKSSHLWDEGTNEGTYDSKSVDDWGVNRDMQQAYKYALLFARYLCGPTQPAYSESLHRPKEKSVQAKVVNSGLLPHLHSYQGTLGEGVRGVQIFSGRYAGLPASLEYRAEDQAHR